MSITVDYYTNYEQAEMLEKYNEFISNYKVKINSLIKRALALENIRIGKVYIGVGIVTKEEIKKINQEFRKIDKETDVLSFPIFSLEEIQKLKQKRDKNEMALGDIILCMDVINEHSKQYNTGFNREMLYMIVHGTCHLLGYDHEKEEDKRKMRAMEEKILEGV